MKKKVQLIKTAARLFATQCYDATTTAQIAKEAGVTEPLIYYHFKGKEEMFHYVQKYAFEEYLRRLEQLPAETRSAMERIENLIHFHFDMFQDLPVEVHLIVNACPNQLRDGKSVAAQHILQQKAHLRKYLKNTIKKGVASGELKDVPLTATADIIITLLNGVLRRTSTGLQNIRGMRTATIAFCRNALLK
jgi:AcrR family transcriptional regulator